MNESQKQSSSNEKENLKETKQDDTKKSIMSESKPLIISEEENEGEDEAKQLSANEEGNGKEDETKRLLATENDKEPTEVKEDDESSEKGEKDDPYYISFKTERKILAQQEEALEEIKDIEREIHSQFDVYPCHSCEFLDPIKELKTIICCGLCTRSFPRYGGIREFWIVSAPKSETLNETFLKLNAVTEGKRLSKNYKFHIPELKIGTMDEFMTLIEQLFDSDRYGEETLQKLLRCMVIVVGNEKDAMKHMLVNQLDLATYLTRFTWNVDKYPLEQSLEDTFASLSKIVRKTAKGLKTRDEEVSYIAKIFEKIKRDREASLLTRPLDKLVGNKDFVSGSEYFKTLLVVVAHENEQKWFQAYETLTEWVVPKSSKKLFSDDSYSLFTVVVIKKFADDFESAARDNKFVVRHFDFARRKDEELDDIYMKKLKAVKKAIFGAAYRWIKAKFSECFVAWIHIKALRVFIESVLRYGIPVNFEATLLIPIKSNKAKLAIDDLYKNLEADCVSGSLKEEIPGVLIRYGVGSYSPYVFVTINTDFIGAKDE